MAPQELPESAAAKRNLRPILEVLRAHLSLEALGLPAGLARPEHAPSADDRGPLFIELGCGYGQHAVAYAGAFPHLVWQPTDVDADKIAVTNARIASLEPAPARTTSVTPSAWTWARPWRELGRRRSARSPSTSCTSPHSTPAALPRRGRRAAPGAALFTYGPYKFDGAFTSPSNADFDRWLKEHDPSWGVREIEVLDMFASCGGFEREQVVDLPANNHLVVWRKAAA